MILVQSLIVLLAALHVSHSIAVPGNKNETLKQSNIEF